MPARILLPVVALVSFMATPYQVLMPVFAAEVFAGGAEMLGFLMGAAGLGGVCGILLLASRREVRGLARWIAGACFCAGAALGLRLFEPPGAFGSDADDRGRGHRRQVNGVSTIILTIADERMRGRMSGYYTWRFSGCIRSAGSPRARWPRG